MKWYGHVLRKDDDDWVNYEVQGPREEEDQRGPGWEVVEKDCQVRKLNKEDGMDCSKWKKLIKDIQWSGYDDDDDWVKYEVQGPREEEDQRGPGWEVVEKDCQVRKLDKEDGTDCSKWKVDKGYPVIRMGVSGWMFLLVLAYPGSPGPKAVKHLCVCVCVVG